MPERNLRKELGDGFMAAFMILIICWAIFGIWNIVTDDDSESQARRAFDSAAQSRNDQLDYLVYAYPLHMECIQTLLYEEAETCPPVQSFEEWMNGR